MRIGVASLDKGPLAWIAAALAGGLWRFVIKRIGDKNMKQSLPVSSIGISAFVICMVVGFVASAALKNPAPLFALGLIGIYLMFSIKVADQWQRVALLRLGRYVGLRGPGMFHIIPIVDTMSRSVDQRVRVANVTAESTLTRDTVPGNVDAVVFWLVWNA